MYKSDFANSLSNIRDDPDVGIGGDKIEDNSSWLSHDQFRDLLNSREQTIRRSSSTIGINNPYHRPDSPRPSIVPRMSTSHISRLQTVMAIKPDLEIGKHEEMERLEMENIRLRRQLESIAKSEMEDNKYASLASEVVRLQDSVTQMEHTKEFYENSTRQLVNVLECLSSQLKTNNSCHSRHSYHCSDGGEHLDSDSFDSLLSQPRPSLESASSKVATVRSSAGDSASLAGVEEENFPTYENVFYSPGNPEKVPSPDPVIFKRPDISKASAPVLPPSSKLARRCDSVGSVLASAPTQVIRPTPVQLRETGARNRILMGSSSVRRAMSNRSNPEHVSFTGLRGLEVANTSLDNPEVNNSVNDIREGNGDSSDSRTTSYLRSKSVASGLPRLGDDSQNSYLHDGSYATKSLLRKKKGDSSGGRGISRFFKQMKSSMNLGKDKNKKNKSMDQESSKYSTLPSHSSVSHLQHQSQSCLTPRKLKQIQHHSTPRLSKLE